MEANTDKSVAERLAELEKRVIGEPKPAAEPVVSLTACNAKAREVAEAEAKKKQSAAALAKSAIDKAFNPTERQRKAEAKMQKPAAGIAAEMKAAAPKAGK